MTCFGPGIRTASVIPEQSAPMITLLKKLLGRSKAPAVAPRVIAPSVVRATPEPVQPIPQVEVAHLSLGAILQKLPDDLQKLVSRLPDDSATVALPLAIIQKQLPTGSVKMSLASLYRQSPPGTFTQTRTEDRRMVEIPLSEVFRHVNPQYLPRRDQRRAEIPQDAVGLFGDSSNPYAVAPGVPDAPPRNHSRSEPQRVVQPPVELKDNGNRAASAPLSPPRVSNVPRAVAQPKVAPRAITPPPGFTAPSATVPADDEADTPPLIVPIDQLAAAWPEPIRSEALGMDGVTVALPTGAVTAGLARGKVAFTWGQIRSWLNPPPASPTECKEATELLLPLKVVAPAFLSQSKPKAPKKSVEIDEAIPALFSGTEAPPEPVNDEIPATPPETASEESPAPVPAPAALAPPPDLTAPAPAPTPAEPVAPVVVRPAPTASIPAPGSRVSGPVGEVLGDAAKTQWTPPDLVKAAVGMPGVAGAVVALQEGLLVAAELPEQMRGETVAAFLPQIFARLNNYAGEMQLGKVEDVLFTTNGAHFQIYRLGEIYFAVLGLPGETLPWDSLRRIVEELAHDHQK